MEKREPLWTVGGINWCSHYRKNSIEFPQKIKNRNIVWSNNSTSGYLSKENKNSDLKRYMHPYVHYSIIYDWQDMETI